MNKYDTWLKFGQTYRCGCCLKIPTYVDIRDLTVCPHCEHLMKQYETDHGVFPIKIQEREAISDEEGEESVPDQSR